MAAVRPRRYYACKQGVTKVPLKDWAAFLNFWTIDHLDTAARVMLVSSADDLSVAGSELLRCIREEYHATLLLEKDAPLIHYQKRLQELYDLGMLNLSLTEVGPRKTIVSQIKAKSRSLSCKLRESKKREQKRCESFVRTKRTKGVGARRMAD